MIFFKFIEEHFVVRLVINIMDINIADDAILIHDKYGAFSVAFFAQDPVFFRDRSVRPKIA